MEEHGGRDTAHQCRGYAQEPPAKRADRAGLAPGAGAPGGDAAAGSDARPGARLEIADGLAHDVAVEAASLIRVTDEKAMGADRIDHARDLVGVPDDALNRFLREDAEVARAGHAQPGTDVVPGAGLRHRRARAHDRDALLELAQLGHLQTGE